MKESKMHAPEKLQKFCNKLYVKTLKTFALFKHILIDNFVIRVSSIETFLCSSPNNTKTHQSKRW